MTYRGSYTVVVFRKLSIVSHVPCPMSHVSCVNSWLIVQSSKCHTPTTLRSWECVNKVLIANLTSRTAICTVIHQYILFFLSTRVLLNAADIMSDDDNETGIQWLVLGVSLAAVLLLIPILSKVKRSRGRNFLNHGIFIVVAIALLMTIPEKFQDMCFSVSTLLMSSSLHCLYFLPNWLALMMMTMMNTWIPTHACIHLSQETGVLIVGSIIPVYESIVAVCTFGESDVSGCI